MPQPGLRHNFDHSLIIEASESKLNTWQFNVVQVQRVCEIHLKVGMKTGLQHCLFLCHLVSDD